MPWLLYRVWLFDLRLMPDRRLDTARLLYRGFWWSRPLIMPGLGWLLITVDLGAGRLRLLIPFGLYRCCTLILTQRLLP